MANRFCVTYEVPSGSAGTSAMMDECLYHGCGGERAGTQNKVKHEANKASNT